MRSIRAHIVEMVLRLSGSKRLMRDPQRFARTFGSDAAAKPAEPGSGMKRRMLVVERKVLGHRVFTVAPRVGGSDRALVYVHGGAYVQDIASFHWNIVEKLVARTGATALVPLYPLAPAAGFEQMFELIRHLLADVRSTGTASKVALVGDSSGGGLALATAMALRDADEPMPDRLLLFSPWLDVTVSGPDQPALDLIDPMLATEGLRRAGEAYAHERPGRDPRISPLFGSLDRLPPVLVLTGTHDVLNSDARRLTAAAARDGVDVVVREYPGMVHVWPAFPIPEGARALDEAAAFLQRN